MNDLRSESTPLDSDHLRPTWCEVDLDAITRNFATLKAMVGPALIIPSLKRNANGCGAAVIARHLEQLRANGICFGNIDDAIAARKAGVRIPILLYPTCLPEIADRVAALDLTITLSTLGDVAAWGAAARAGEQIKVFLKLDGGGLRAGALPSQAVEVAKAIASEAGLSLCGAYGHPMATYGADDESFTPAQLAEFVAAFQAIEAAGIHLPIRMAASSSIVVGFPAMDLDAVDPGRLLFGSSFAAVPERQRDWLPAIVGLKSRLVMRKPLDELGSMALAPFFPVRPGMILGLIPYGWGDGYPRQLPQGATVLIRGRRVPLLSPPHSELIRVDLTDVPDARLGDEVVLLGRSGDLEITSADICRQWGVSLAEFYAALPGHLPRVYKSA